MNRIAIISLNNNIKEQFKDYLSSDNYLVLFPEIETFLESQVDLVIFDFNFLKHLNISNIRSEYLIKTVPIMLIVDNSFLKNHNTNYGADDFILETASKEEFMLRIKLLIQRIYGINTGDITQIDGLTIDLAQHKVLINFQQIDITFMEFRLLQFFSTNQDRAFSRNYILEKVWGYNYYGGTRTVDVHVRRLRSKLGNKYGQYIQTVRSVGYKFTKPS